MVTREPNLGIVEIFGMVETLRYYNDIAGYCGIAVLLWHCGIIVTLRYYCVIAVLLCHCGMVVVS